MTDPQYDPYHDVDWEREDNLPPSALINMLSGLLVAVLMVLLSGVGAIYNEVQGGSAVTGAIVGAIVGVVLAIVFVVVQMARLRSRGR